MLAVRWQVVTDRAAALAYVIVELMPDAMHNTDQSHRRRPNTFVQYIRRGHYELGTEARHDRLRVAAALDELTIAI